MQALSIIFKNCIDCGVFPDTWKMSHIIPAHKKNDKRSLNNYHPLSLLPTCGKSFERIIFNNLIMFLYLLKIIIYLLLINQVLGLMTHVSISVCQLCTVFI